VCYDHLAGEKGVALFARLCDSAIITLSGGRIDITQSGISHLADFGVDVNLLRLAKRPMCRSCLDWSERRSHLAGALGAALLERMFAAGWAVREQGTRIVQFTSAGEEAFDELFREITPDPRHRN